MIIFLDFCKIDLSKSQKIVSIKHLGHVIKLRVIPLDLAISG